MPSKSEARFTPPSELCPHPERWTSNDIEATENEVLELVAGLVRGLQPDLVVESGTHLGDGSAAIGEALRANGHGHLHTFELDPGIVGKAARRFPDLAEWVTFHEGKAEDWTPTGPIDFAFLDSSPGSRVMEFHNLHPHMTQRTVLVFHDTAPHLPLRRLLATAQNIPPLVLVDLPTPRGVSIGQLPRILEL